MTDNEAVPLVYLVKGEDPVLLDAAVHKLVDSLLPAVDRLYALEDFTIESRRRASSDSDADDTGEPDTPTMRAVLNALASPPWMTPCRVVVVRDISNLSADQAPLIAEYVSQPFEKTFLVLVHGGGRMPSSIDKALKATNAPTVSPDSEKTDKVLDAALKSARLKLSSAARSEVVTRLGDDAARVHEFVEVLKSTYGRPSAELDVDDIDPYLGESGTVARYALTNNIDDGETARALEVLHRLLHATSAKQPKPLHPMQIMATLTGYYESMLRLDSPTITTSEHAAAILGGNPNGSGFRLRTAKRLGSDGLAEAIGYLAQADLDLRGGLGGRRALPDETVIEILVARLAALARRKGAAPRAAAGRARR